MEGLTGGDRGTATPESSTGSTEATSTSQDGTERSDASPGAATQPSGEQTGPAASGRAPAWEQVKGGAVVTLGMTGPVVNDMQNKLTQLGFPVQETGTLGPTTQAVLRAFQKAYRIQQTGELGATTWAALQRALNASLTLSELLEIAPQLDVSRARTLLPYLNASMLHANINTDARKAAYIAQLAHESDGFQTLEEYSSGAQYEWRSDLGNNRAGDGRRFKGRGGIQLTGRANYQATGQRLGIDLVNDPTQAATPELGFLVSADYWKERDLNKLADNGDFEGITDVINYYDPERQRRKRRNYHRRARIAIAKGRQQRDQPQPEMAQTLQAQTSGEQTTGDQDTPEAVSGAWQETFRGFFDQILAGETDAVESSVAMSARVYRNENNIPVSAPDAVNRTHGEIWQLADHLGAAKVAIDAEDWSTAKDRAHRGAETARRLRARGGVDASQAEAAIQFSQRLWKTADAGTQQATDSTRNDGRGRRAVWSTGRRGGGRVQSQELARDGSWGGGNFLAHHSDRSNSWAANNIRDARNRDLQAYDFTFERTNASGEGIAGSALGLPLITPWDAKVIDIQHDYQGSGGYGRFIALESVETGLRIQVNHLDTVSPLRRGQVVSGGTEFGTQGGSGRTRRSFATHVDIVGTRPAVEDFVRSNQSGEFKTSIEATQS